MTDGLTPLLRIFRKHCITSKAVAESRPEHREGRREVASVSTHLMWAHRGTEFGAIEPVP